LTTLGDDEEELIRKAKGHVKKEVRRSSQTRTGHSSFADSSESGTDSDTFFNTSSWKFKKTKKFVPGLGTIKSDGNSSESDHQERQFLKRKFCGSDNDDSFHRHKLEGQTVEKVVQFTEVLTKATDLFDETSALYILSEKGELTDQELKQLEEQAKRYNELVDKVNQGLQTALSEKRKATEILDEVDQLKKDIEVLSGVYDNLAPWCLKAKVSELVKRGVENLSKIFQKSNQALRQSLLDNAKKQMTLFADTNHQLKEKLDQRREKLIAKQKELKEACEALNETNAKGLKSQLDETGSMLDQLQKKVFNFKIILKFVKV